MSTSRLGKCLLAFALVAIPLRAAGHLELESPSGVAGSQVQVGIWYRGTTNVMQLVQAGFSYDNTRLEFASAALEPGIAAKFPTLVNFAAVGASGVTLQLSNTNVNANLAPDTKIGAVTFTIKPAAPVGAVPLPWTAVFLDSVNSAAASISGAVNVVKLFNAADATLTMAEDAPATAVDLTGKFTNEDGAPVAATVTAVSDPANGEAEIDDDGNVVYRPNRNFNGTDTFDYTATDGTYTDTGTVTVTVNAVNDIPELRTTSVGNGWWQEYRENSGLASVFTDVDVVDPDFDPGLNALLPQTNYNDATFYAFIDNRQEGDELTYRPAADPSRLALITVNDARQVFFSDVHIGTVEYTEEGLKVTFLGDSRTDITPAVIHQLVVDLCFRNDSDAPSDAERVIRVALDDSTGPKVTSEHMSDLEVYFIHENTTVPRALLEIEFNTSAAVRSVSVIGNGGATVGTVDQYGNPSGMEAVAGLVGVEGWCQYMQEQDQFGGPIPGYCEWEVGLKFSTWAAMLAAFPPAGGLRIRLNYWDGTTSFLEVNISGVPATQPTAPDFNIGVAGTTINVNWANNTGGANANVLVVDIESPDIYDDEDDEEFMTQRVGGVWAATSTSFTGLGPGQHEVACYAGGILYEEEVIDGVSVTSIWAGGSFKRETVGNDVFTVSGTITDTTYVPGRAYVDNIRASVHKVDGFGMWQYYGEIEGGDLVYQGNGVWSYSAVLADTLVGDEFYLVQAYLDHNWNNTANRGEPHGQTYDFGTEQVKILAGGTFNFNLVPKERSDTRDWSLIGDAYLYVTPVNDPPVNTVLPSITGTVRYGQTVTANPGDWNDDLDYPEGEAPAVTDFAYQWYMGEEGDGPTAAPIVGQTGATLELTADLVGKFIAVEVTATDQGVGVLEDRAVASATVRSAWSEVAKAPLTVTAQNKSKTYGAANPALTYTVTGFLYADNEGNFAPGVTIATTATVGSAVGGYPITVEDAASDRYDITFQNATLTVNRAALTVTANNKSKTYGDANPALDYGFTGFVLGEGEGDLDTGVTISTTAVQNSPVGGYPITVSGATDANYTVSFVPGTLTINRFPVTVTADGGQEKTYGDPDPAPFSYTTTPAVLPNAEALEGALTREPGEDVDDYQIQQGTLTNATNGNYNITYVAADFAINKAPLTIKANDASRNFFQPNSAINYSASFGPVPVRGGLVGGDTPDEFDSVLEFSTDAVNGSPHSGAYKTMVTISPANLAALPASNYDISFADGVLSIEANAPTRNAVNSEAKRLLVVSGRTTQIDLRLFFADADIQYGDQLVFSDLGVVTGGNGNETVAFEVLERATGIVTFNPHDSVGGETYVDLDFTVKVQDSANPVNLLGGTADGVATIYLRLIDNQAPVIIAASPADADGDVSADDIEQIVIYEGDAVQVSLTASDETDPSGDDGIASIDFQYSWDNTVWTDLNPEETPVRAGAVSATSAQLATDKDTVSFLEGTKLLYVRAIVTDGMGVEAVKRWEFTVHNVNLQPTLADIANVSVMEDNENNDELTVLLTGVSNGGENNDPKITASNPDTRGIGATISAETNRSDIIASIALAEVANGDMQTFRLSYTLAPDANGVATVTVTVDDGTGAVGRETNHEIVKTFTITVNPVNDAPVNTVAPSISGTPHVGRVLTANPGTWNDDKDLDWVEENPVREGGITFAYQWQVGELAEARDMGLAWSNIPGATAGTFTPALAQNLKWVRVLVTATDSGIPLPGESATAASPQVFVANAAPVFTAGATITIYGFEDMFQPVTLDRVALLPEPGFDFTLAATDPDEDALAWSVSTAPGHGTASVDQNGNVSYEPNLNYYNTGDLPELDTRNGGESFVVKVDDGLGGTATITVHVVVVAVNDAPEITSLSLQAFDALVGGNPVSLSKPDDIARIVATVLVDDVDDTVFTYGYEWTVERRTLVDLRGPVTIDTGAVNELTTADLFANGLGSAFLDNDKVTVTVTVTDSGGGQEYDEPGYGLPRLRSDEASKQVLLGSPAWFPQVPVLSLIDEGTITRTTVDDEFYEITFAYEGVKVVTVVVKVVDDKDYPYPAEYLAAVWPVGYEVKGMRSDRTYEVTRVRKFVGGVWVEQELAAGGDRQPGHPTVTVEEYDAPSITSEQGGVLDRLQNATGAYTGDYRAVFSMESVGGYRYTWIGPGTNVEELVLFDADPDGTFPTSRQDRKLIFNNITVPGVYTLTVIPLNPESQFGGAAARVADQEEWVLDIDQAEIDANQPGQTPPEADDWGMTPGWKDEDEDGINEFNVGDPEYVGTLAEDQLGVELMLSWNTIPDTQQYYLLLSNAAGVPIREYNRVPVGRLPRAPVFLGAGTYQWRVAAVNAAGNRDWSGVAWIQVRGVGDAADAIGLAEDRTPYVENGVVAALANWGPARAAGALELTCNVKVGEAGEMALRVYLTSGSTVVFDQWVGLPDDGSTRAAGDYPVTDFAVPGLVLAPNTQYALTVLPRNVVAGTTYVGPWSQPTVFGSGAPFGEFNFSAVTGPTFVSGSMVFSFAGSNIATGEDDPDLIEYQVSIRRDGVWTNLAAAQKTGADLEAGNLTLPTVIQAGDSIIVRMRVQRDGVWTEQRLFWGVAPAPPPTR